MQGLFGSNIFDLPELRDEVRVFQDRIHGGRVLAEMLESYRGGKGIVLAVPAGGVPVGAVVAELLGLPLDVAVVSKITVPWDTEAGYGAVAFDGTVKLNHDLLSHLRLSAGEVEKGVAKTTAKVSHRVRKLRGDKPLPDLAGRPVVLVDDGLASGFTMRVAAAALDRAGADLVIAAVPTGHLESVERLAARVHLLYCPNVRGGWRYAVADAYRAWSDVDEHEVVTILERYGS